ncbi:MAG TPA: PIN domain-containing protein [Polyangiales bacterium]|jgi:hypothetical protein|nr:PIN domain-containing protein [Polyangiales bacterium]
MTLVDTSVWIEFFRGHEPVATQLEQLLDENEVAVCGPVAMELRRGIKSARERSRVMLLLGGCHELPQPAHLWDEAGDLGFVLARRGVSAKSLDLVIATYALSHDVTLFSTDSDFRAMKKAGVPLHLA